MSLSTPCGADRTCRLWAWHWAKDTAVKNSLPAVILSRNLPQSQPHTYFCKYWWYGKSWINQRWVELLLTRNSNSHESSKFFLNGALQDHDLLQNLVFGPPVLLASNPMQVTDMGLCRLLWGIPFTGREWAEHECQAVPIHILHLW